MAMDCSQLIQSLESLWFFTNVVSSRTLHAGNGIKEESTQPMSSILQTSLQNHDEYSPEQEFLTLKCSDCRDLAAEIEERYGDEPIIKIEEVEIPKPTKKEEKRKRRPGRKRSKRKILGKLDMGFGSSSRRYKLDYGFGVFDDKETWGYGMFGSQLQHEDKMPPLNDGMAMKEHLKYWAYAVACAVR